jgi:hypothetical protein
VPDDVKPDAATETALIEVLERFCSGFADQDAEAVMRLLARGPRRGGDHLRGAVALRTRGASALSRPLVAGPTTYSWEWRRHDVSKAGSVAWLLAEGTRPLRSRTA